VSGKTSFNSGSVEIEFANTGHRAAVFQVRSAIGDQIPWTYTVGPSANLSNTWAIKAAGQSRYDLSVYGPNGFMRVFKGSASGQSVANLSVDSSYDLDSNTIALNIKNTGSATAELRISDNYAGHTTRHPLQPGMSLNRHYNLDHSYGWYDLVIEVPSDATFQRRLAGHLETGEPSITDPAIGMQA
jgi:phospholipase C